MKDGGDGVSLCGFGVVIMELSFFLRLFGGIVVVVEVVVVVVVFGGGPGPLGGGRRGI